MTLESIRVRSDQHVHGPNLKSVYEIPSITTKIPLSGMLGFCGDCERNLLNTEFMKILTWRNAPNDRSLFIIDWIGQRQLLNPGG